MTSTGAKAAAEKEAGAQVKDPLREKIDAYLTDTPAAVRTEIVKRLRATGLGNLADAARLDAEQVNGIIRDSFFTYAAKQKGREISIRALADELHVEAGQPDGFGLIHACIT